MLSVLTLKPAHQAKALIEALASISVQAHNFATITINAAKNTTAIASAGQCIHNVDAAIFTSANAVLPALNAWPPAQHPKAIFAVGPATAAALQHQGITCAITPEHPSSQGLLALPQLATNTIANKNVTIFTGERAKPLLRRTLMQRQAHVTEVACYRRSCATPSASELNTLISTPTDWIIATSLEALHNLFQIVLPQHLAWLLSKRLLVINTDMQRFAMQAGFLKQRITLADNASQAAILAALQGLQNQKPQ